LEPISLETVLAARKNALVIIDVQNEFCHPEGPFARKGRDMSIIDGMLQPLASMANSARKYGVPVVFVRNVEDSATDSEAWTLRPDGDEREVNGMICRRGSWGTEFYEITPQPEDIVVEKHRFSAFVNTRLDTVLRARKIETLVLASVASNVCVESTARHAVMLDYHVVLAEDACASWDRAAHEMTKHNTRRFFGKVTDSGTIVRLWSA
jgi:ureidoacrylate peracid hydrolase